MCLHPPSDIRPEKTSFPAGNDWHGRPSGLEAPSLCDVNERVNLTFIVILHRSLQYVNIKMEIICALCPFFSINLSFYQGNSLRKEFLLVSQTIMIYIL